MRGEVRAVDLAKGTLLNNAYFASSGVAGAGIWHSPALSPDGGTLVVATGEDFRGANGPYTRAIVTLDPATLTIRQADQEGATGNDLDFGTTPVIFHDSTGRLLTGANHKNGTFYAYVLDKVSSGPALVPRHRHLGRHDARLRPDSGRGGTLFIAANGKIYAVDPATGKDRWAAVSVGTMHGNMAIASGMIFANTGASGVQVLDEAKGTHLRTLLPANAGAANSGVVVANGAVYWLSGSYVNAWGLPAPAVVVPTGFADTSFSNLWTRTDSLVASHAASRSWLWGPVPNTKGLMEAYAQGTGGKRLVQYFDKSRMEISHPEADPNGAFYVTNGLLVVEMISGRVQVGDHTYETRSPATANVAGDANDAQAPTYKSFQGVANTTLGDHKAADRTGQFATATLTRAGVVGDDQAKRSIRGPRFRALRGQCGPQHPEYLLGLPEPAGACPGERTGGPSSAEHALVLRERLADQRAVLGQRAHRRHRRGRAHPGV